MFCPEQYIEQDNFVRVIDAFVDAIDLDSFGFRHVTTGEEGRPPYHPSILLKLYIYGYRYGIRSSRKLERQAKINLEVRWLLSEQTPSNRTNHTGDQLQQCAFSNIITYVSPKAPSTKDIGLYSIASFIYNPVSDTYTCPAGEILTTNNVWYKHSSEGRTPAFRFNRYLTSKCSSCSQRNLCTNSCRNGRAIDRSEYAEIIAQNANRVNESPNYYRLRQQIAEHPWGTLKRQWAFDYVLMKGKRQVLGEVSLAFIGYNLMRSVCIMTPEKFIEKLLHSPFLLQKIQNQTLFCQIDSVFLEIHKMAS